MQFRAFIAAVSCLVSFSSFAQHQEPHTAPTPPVASVETSQTETERRATDRHFGIHGGLNLGLLAFDVQFNKNFYTFAAFSIGAPMATDGRVFASSFGSGLSIGLTRSAPSMLFFDAFIINSPVSDRSLVSGSSFRWGIGVGVGLRYIHRSGFTAALKLPVLGSEIGAPSVGAGVGSFFTNQMMALPVASVGYSF